MLPANGLCAQPTVTLWPLTEVVGVAPVGMRAVVAVPDPPPTAGQ